MQARELADAVHDALASLYETQYLQTHPLAAYVAPDVPQSERGQALHRKLRAAIEKLRPPAGTPQHALAWRPYRYLNLRYVEALTLHDVAAQLSITERHCRRVHKEALAALSQQLSSTTTPVRPDEPRAGSPDSQSLLKSEVSRLGVAQEPPASLRETVLGVVETLATLARSTGVDVGVTLGPIGDLTIDRLLVRQVLLNLLVHAIHTQAGGHIDLRSFDDPPSVRLEIVLHSPSETASVAVRADDEHLVIAQHLAKMRGAAIAVERQTAALRYVITLPTASLRKVLLIDDNPDFLYLFRRYLAGGHYQVLEATTPEEALRLAQADQPDVITLDVLMPGQDGWEILQRLKHHRLTSHIPVIVCSVVRDRELALSLGASGFLAKPVGQAGLLAALDHYCAPSQ